jgi:chemosensory pili system protein ChpE
MFVTALTGALMALSFSAPPGPVAMETVRRGLRGGFWPALQVQLGSVIGDLTWCLAALLGLAPLVAVPGVRGVLAAAGVGVLAYLGLTGVREALRGPGVAAGPAAAPSADSGRGAFRSGLAISMANPMAVGYWLSVGGALVAAGVAGANPAQTTAFIAGFAAGTLAWAATMAAAVRWGRSLLTPRVFRWVTLACSVALLLFGASLALESFA